MNVLDGSGFTFRVLFEYFKPFDDFKHVVVLEYVYMKHIEGIINLKHFKDLKQ